MINQVAFTVQWPGKLVFGPGRLANLGDEAKALGRRAFLATTADLSALGLTTRVQGLLAGAGLAVTLYEDVQPDPTCAAVDAAAAQARAAGCDLVIGLGGGSAIDLAKGVAVAATHAGPVWNYVTYTGANARPVTAAVLPIIAVPTTAGTGSEVTLGTVLDNPDTAMKAALLSPHVYPRVALVDPELTYTMPPKVTVMTGFDALTHGMEAYLNAARSNPASDLFALETVRRVVRYLPRVVADGGDREARAQMAWAATLGGISIALSNTTVAHAMGLPMGARLGTPHGLALSRLLPVVLSRSWAAQPARYAALAEAVGAVQTDMDEMAKAEALPRWLHEFIGQVGLAALWTRQDIDDSILDVLADDVFRYMGRPVQQHLPIFTRGEMRQMFEEALLPSA
ncbi:MAG: iron-containing alcohol dehydrogenase [Chloroflexi bacterium]|nr:iron-containing alcohol dehydrogenase [Chloroflexota bacterium]